MYTLAFSYGVFLRFYLFTFIRLFLIKCHQKENLVLKVEKILEINAHNHINIVMKMEDVLIYLVLQDKLEIEKQRYAEIRKQYLLHSNVDLQALQALRDLPVPLEKK